MKKILITTIGIICIATAIYAGTAQSVYTVAQIDAYIANFFTSLGISAGDTDFGEFTGDTLSDNEDAKTLLQELETAIETKQDGLSAMSEAEGTTGTETTPRSITAAVLKAVIEALAGNDLTVTAHGSVSSGTENFSNGIHSITVAGDQTWSFTWPDSGERGRIEVWVTNGGSATIGGLSGVLTSGGTGISWTTSGIDVVVFTSMDGGTTVYAFQGGEDMQ